MTPADNRPNDDDALPARLLGVPQHSRGKPWRDEPATASLARRSCVALLLALVGALAVSAPHTSQAEGTPAPAAEGATGSPGVAGMRTIRTRHYRIHTDLDPELAADLGQRLDGMYDEYRRRLANFRVDASAPPLEVHLFRRQQDYLRFTGQRWRNSGGVYMSGRNLLAAFLEGQGRDALRRTLQHEAFHQFAHAAISPDIPVWLNEGMAQLFEEGIWTGSSFWLGQVPPRRIRQLQADLRHRRLRRFDHLMSVTPEQWAATLAGDHGHGATQYNQSWAMVHFLVQAKDGQGREKYRTRLLRMLDHLHAGKSGKDAFETAFSANTKGFEDRFVEYARQLTATPEASLIERQEVLADLLMELRRQGRTFERVADLRDAAVRARYTLRYSERGMEWTSDPDIGAYFCDAAGRPFDAARLYFSPRPGAPLPDIVCRADDRLQFRTRFHPAAGAGGDGAAGKFEREVLVESPGTTASARD